MSDPYLLAASLLSVGPIPVAPPPALPPDLPYSFSTLLTSTATQTLQPDVNHKIVPFIEISSPEFSQPSSAEGKTYPASEPIITLPAAAESVPNQQALPEPQSTALIPVSGSQLYLQRLAALQAGKLYTRLPPDSFQSFWAKDASKEPLLLKEPTHEQWIRLLEQEAKAVAKGQGDNRLSILIGDSLSMWFPSKGLPGTQLWLNQGISGENTGQILKRLSAFSEARPDTIYVMAGINDLRQGKSDRVILDNLREIMRRLRLNHPQSQVIVQSILPTRLSAIPNERIRNLNQEIAFIAQQEGAGYLNLHTLFADGQGELEPELTTDGLHLTRRGYEVWQQGLNYAESVMATNQTN